MADNTTKKTETSGKKYPVNYQKPNRLISLLYDSTILDNKIMALAYTKIMNYQECDMSAYEITIQLTVKEICLCVGLKENNHAYEKLKESTKRLMNKVYFESNDKNQEFVGFTVFSQITCAHGIYEIKFSSVTSDIFRNIIKEHYTRFPLEMMLSFKTNGAFRLYESLKEKCFNREDNTYKLTFTLNELRVMLGTINNAVAMAGSKMNSSDSDIYDAMVRYAKAHKLLLAPEDRNFCARYLYPAIKELNEKSDIHIEYEPCRDSSSAITSFAFTVSYKSWPLAVKAKVADNSVPQELLSLTKALFSDFSESDCIKVVRASDGDKSKITKAFACWYPQKDKVDVPIAWVISAIKNDYKPSGTSVKDNKKNSAWNYSEKNSYDYKRINAALLASNKI